MPFTEQGAKLHWEALYDNGTSITEGTRKYADLPRYGLVSFSLLEEDDSPKVVIPLNPDRTLFYRMRVNLHFTGKSERFYIAGYRTKHDKMYLEVVYPDGTVETFNSFEDARLHPIEFWKQEKVN